MRRMTLALVQLEIYTRTQIAFVIMNPIISLRQAQAELQEDCARFEFVPSDILEFQPKIKHMNFIDHSEGMSLFMMAERKVSLHFCI